MQISVPVTDYIRASLLTTNEDIIKRIAGVAARMPIRSWVKVNLSGNQNIPTGVATIAEFDSESWDTREEFNPVTHQFVASENGVYLFHTQIRIQIVDDAEYVGVQLMYNNVNNLSYSAKYLPGGFPGDPNVTLIHYLSADDTMHVEVIQNQGAAQLLMADVNYTYFVIARLV